MRDLAISGIRPGAQFDPHLVSSFVAESSSSSGDIQVYSKEETDLWVQGNTVVRVSGSELIFNQQVIFARGQTTKTDILAIWGVPIEPDESPRAFWSYQFEEEGIFVVLMLDGDTVSDISLGLAETPDKL